MSLYKGDRKLSLWQGDHKPYALFKKMKGNKNIFDVNAPYSAIGAKPVPDGINVKFTVTRVGNRWKFGSMYFNVKKNTPYTFHYKATDKSREEFQPRVIVNAGDKELQSFEIEDAITFTPTVDRIYISFYVELEVNNPNTKIGDYLTYTELQLEEGESYTGLEPPIHLSQLAGAVKTHKTGKDQISFESVYKAKIPSLKLKGMGFQGFKTGKNILDRTLMKGMFYKYTMSYENDSIALKAPKGTNIYGFQRSNNGLLQVGKTYSFSAESVSWHQNDKSSWGWRLKFSDMTYTEVTDNLNWTITISKPVESIMFYFSFGQTPDLETYTLVKPQIEEGTEATDYEEYCGGTPAPNPNYAVEPVWNENNVVEVEGSNLLNPEERYGDPTGWQDAYFFSKKNNMKNYLFKKGVTYTIQYYGKEEDINGIVIRDSNDATKKYQTGRTNTFTPSENFYGYVNFWFKKTGWDERMSMIIGTMLKPYQPYVEKQTKNVPLLRAIPNTEYADEWNEATGDKTIIIKELVLTGDEKWAIEKNPFHRCFQLYGVGAFTDNKAILSFCNSYKSVSRDYEYGNDVNFVCVVNANSVRFVDNRFTNVTEWKENLSKKYAEGNPVKVWYVLAEPVIEHSDEPPLMQSMDGTITQLGGDCGVGDMEAVVYEEIE